MKRQLGTVAVTLALTGATLAGAAGTAGAATTAAGPAGTPAACSNPWGSGVKSAADPTTGHLSDIRTGRHACYDRMVFDIGATNRNTGYHVGYVDAFHQDGSGDPIPVAGGAILQIYVNAPTRNLSTGQETYPARGKQPLPGVDITGYQTFKDHKFGASFEGQSQVGLGVRAKLPFRVTRTTTQIVVDVAHAW
ncbi:hypothetical protein [Streptomyces sp. NPDC058953]|uniref:AMIN-like domain-containing (lipo)protein n=1 Tax=unclassified Streptomyces TaxID=2593676 RepID=UPI0036B102E1